MLTTTIKRSRNPMMKLITVRTMRFSSCKNRHLRSRISIAKVHSIVFAGLRMVNWSDGPLSAKKATSDRLKLPNFSQNWTHGTRLNRFLARALWKNKRQDSVIMMFRNNLPFWAKGTQVTRQCNSEPSTPSWLQEKTNQFARLPIISQKSSMS